MSKNKGGASTKEKNKIKTKIVEDKTFGLKNKNKSKKVQQFIKTVKTQVDNRFGDDKRGDFKKEKKSLQEELLQQQLLMNQLFKPAITQPKLAPGVDPKSVVCAFFKNGTCQKGDKCKFSHDLDVERKAAKINIYEDPQEKDSDTIDKWDDEKLQSVVDSKHKGQVVKSNKICNYFLDALKEKKYGWFWECPNGADKCHYKHCLPLGYTLKMDGPVEEKKDEINIADQLEDERQKLRENSGNLTPVTLERFLEWKKKKAEEKLKQEEEESRKRMEDIKSGKVMMSGREILLFNPELFNVNDDDDAFDLSQYKKEDTETGDDKGDKDDKVDQPKISSNIDESLFNEEDLPEDSEDD
eukprot:TRINITY_DN1034_c0_g2_i1.p1 TRINITY_DN1034_c0_g2~~TRINITY_DN1034_c0_g2_i1.p1  ORF type:complete len:355 (+),score=121.62 TRINITY_DN1034_c0_g2_i1:39-1103(+)